MLAERKRIMSHRMRNLVLILGAAAALFAANRAAAQSILAKEADHGGLLNESADTTESAAVVAAQSNTATNAPRAWRLGTELDALPYLTKGYYGSLIAVHSDWRLRGVAARSTMPGFMVSSGYKDKRTDAYALLADRFVGPNRSQQKGPWAGGGVEFWRNRIRRKGSPDYSHFNNTVLTVGGGYVWRLSPHLYLNPWSGAHFVVGGNRDIAVSGTTYKQPIFTPEASVKFGITF